MGMYDTIQCSYDLGPGFWNRSLQTKDLLCTMMDYWIDPAGRMYEIDYSGTQDFLMTPEDDTPLWKGIRWIPNGTHGRVSPVYYTKIIEVYPSVWDCKYSAFPRCKILLEGGIIREFAHQSND